MMKQKTFAVDTHGKWSDDDLLAHLKKRKFYPLFRSIQDSSGQKVVFDWTDTPPFCHREVAYQRAMEVATKGYSKISLPSGYEKRDKPGAPSVLLISQKDQKVAESRASFQTRLANSSSCTVGGK